MEKIRVAYFQMQLFDTIDNVLSYTYLSRCGPPRLLLIPPNPSAPVRFKKKSEGKRNYPKSPNFGTLEYKKVIFEITPFVTVELNSPAAKMDKKDKINQDEEETEETEEEKEKRLLEEKLIAEEKERKKRIKVLSFFKKGTSVFRGSLV